ncbi:MAG: LUD domain-containing protein [Bacteroidales bacterium]|nr:LUD domain-containing protein [Bacteroidales bacterium]
MKDRKGSDKGTTNKEQILAMVRNAIIEKPEAIFQDIDLRSDTWKPIKEEDGNAITFVQKFKDMGGIFIYLENEAEFGDCMKQLAPQNKWEPLWCSSPKMQPLLEKYGLSYSAEPVIDDKHKLVSITDCEYLIAQTGSIVLTDYNTGSRKAYTDSDVLLILSRTDQIVSSVKEALQRLKNRLSSQEASQAVIITGQTRTYDIEQELVQSVFGPRQIAVFLIDE